MGRPPVVAGVNAFRVCMKVTGMNLRLTFPRHTLRFVTNAMGKMRRRRSRRLTFARGRRRKSWQKRGGDKVLSSVRV